MRFATRRQIVILTLLWTAALYAADFVLHPRPLQALETSAPATMTRGLRQPRVTLWMNHLCCSGCLNDLRAALGGMSWVGTISLSGGDVPSRSDADAGRVSPSGSRNRVEIDVTRIESVDFVALNAAARRAGFALDRMEISGIGHYHFEVDLPHFCCGACSLAATQEADRLKALRGTGRLQWLDSVTIMKPRKRMIVYARYGQVANVTELADALDWIGFAPSAIRLSVEGESVRM